MNRSSVFNSGVLLLAPLITKLFSEESGLSSAADKMHYRQQDDGPGE